MYSKHPKVKLFQKIPLLSCTAACKVINFEAKQRDPSHNHGIPPKSNMNLVMQRKIFVLRTSRELFAGFFCSFSSRNFRIRPRRGKAGNVLRKNMIMLPGQKDRFKPPFNWRSLAHWFWVSPAMVDVEWMPNNRGFWNFVHAVHVSWVYFPLQRGSDQQGYLKEYNSCRYRSASAYFLKCTVSWIVMFVSTTFRECFLTESLYKSPSCHAV